VSRESLERAVAPRDRLLLDSSVLIAYLEGDEAASPAATHVLDVLVRSGRNPAVVSAVAAMEVMVRPLRQGPVAFRNVNDFLSRYRNLLTREVDMHVAREAAGLVARSECRGLDALIVATGLVCQVGHLVTNDARWQRQFAKARGRIRVLYLGDHVPFS
jgi:predicted nucleic acid-binding protein